VVRSFCFRFIGCFLTYAHTAVSFTFAQVGNDKKAARLLRNLSNDTKTKEYVDCLLGKHFRNYPSAPSFNSLTVQLESTLESIDIEGLKWDVVCFNLHPR
jgi:hypothetical protein